jgi:hypothetical protein
MVRNPDYLGLHGVLEMLDNVRQAGNQYEARCPAHDDEHASLTVTLGRGRVLVRCHAGDGCTFKAICAALNVKPELFFEEGRESRYYKAVFEEKPKGGRWEARIEKVYPYVDAEGKLLFETLRLGNPKDFRQRRPDNRGGYIWNLQGVTRVLYRLPKVREAVAAGRPVFLVEGEKDVETLERWGLTATTNPMGAEKWDPSYDRALMGAKLIILPDNDEAGRRHIIKVAVGLHGKAESIRILDLPGLAEKGDVSDWVASGGTFDEFERLVQALQPWTPSPQDGLPEIIVSDRPLRSTIEDAVRALERGNTPPRLFVRTGSLTRWRHDEKGRPLIEPLGMAHLRNELTESADFFTVSRNGPRHTAPPDNVLAGVLALGRWSLPSLANITETPVLRPDGTILDEPGYDPATQLVYAPVSGLQAPRVPSDPTEEEVAAALALVWEVLGDFPFADCASRTNTLALLLTPILRPAINGPVPLALIDAPQQGTGKSLLAEIVTLITTGRPAAMMQAPTEDEEWRKALTSAFRNGETMMTYDNVDSKLSAPSLAMAITASVWRDRVLGGSEMFEFPVSCTWMATGNNLQPDGDMPRRAYWIRLDAKMARPWQRTTFKHTDLRGWVLANRGRLIAALLTLCRAWFAAGCPKAEVPLMGSFEGWTRVVGGVLAHAGVGCFLGNLEQMYEAVETTDQQWEAFLIEWRARYGLDEKKVADVVADLRNGGPRPGQTAVIDPEYELLRELVPDEVRFDGEASEDKLRTRLGQALKKRLGVRYGVEGLHFALGAKDAHAKTQRWRVLTSEESEQEARLNTAG